jgi:hypothetical protein
MQKIVKCKRANLFQVKKKHGPVGAAYSPVQSLHANKFPSTYTCLPLRLYSCSVKGDVVTSPPVPWPFVLEGSPPHPCRSYFFSYYFFCSIALLLNYTIFLPTYFSFKTFLQMGVGWYPDLTCKNEMLVAIYNYKCTIFWRLITLFPSSHNKWVA